MELLQLEYFYAVAQNQHMTRTAEQLHIAQPSLTQSIRRLEKELGVPLFYHSGRNIALTEYGVVLQEALTPVLKTLHQIPNQLQQLAQERETTIRLNVLAASTLVTRSAGRSCASRALRRAATMAALESWAALPPRRTMALPDLTARAAVSTVTLGRAS